MIMILHDLAVEPLSCGVFVCVRLGKVSGGAVLILLGGLRSCSTAAVGPVLFSAFVYYVSVCVFDIDG